MDAAVYTVPTDAPEADGTLSWDTTTVVLAQAHAGGTVGTGTLAGVVQGRETPDADGAFDAMVKAVRNAGRPDAAGYVISAADVALWDLKARLPDLPRIGSSAPSARRYRSTAAAGSPPLTSGSCANS